MKGIDGLELIRMIKYGEIEENTRIIVLEDNKEYDVYDVVAELTYKGGETLWGEGTFRLSMLYDKKHFFEIIEEEKEIEYPLLHRIGGNETTGDKMPNQEYLINCNFEHLNKAVYQLIDEVNKLKKEGK